MYQYNYADQTLVDERVAQFRDQTKRFLAGELPEEQFLPLRLQNGLYIQRYAPMLRIAIPYGLFASYQLRKLAEITRKYDKGYGHFTTRTNIQLNWPKLEDVPVYFGKSRLQYRCMRFKRWATVFVIPQPTLMLVSTKKRLQIRVLTGEIIRPAVNLSPEVVFTT